MIVLPELDKKTWSNQEAGMSLVPEKAQKVFSKHPQFIEYEPHLKLAMESYFGVGGFLDGSRLQKFSIREAEDRYKERKEISWFAPFHRTIIDVYPNAIFSSGVTRTEKVDGIEKLFKSRFGNRNETMRQACIMAKLFSVCIVGVDRENDDKDPTVKIINPLNVIDWSLDGDAFEWVKILKEQPGWRGDPLSPHGQILRRIELWTNDSIRVFDEIPKGKADHAVYGRWKPVQTRDNTLGFVPYFPFWPGNAREDGSLYGSSESLQLARINNRLFNLFNERDTQTRDQTYNILTFPTEDGLPPKDLEMGSNQTLFYNASLGSGPAFISPNEGPIQICGEVAQDLIKYMYQIMRLDYETGVSPSSVSATQRVYIGEEAAKAIRTLSKSAEGLEYRITKALLEFKNDATLLSMIEDPNKFMVTYPDNFDGSINGESFINRILSIASIVLPSRRANIEKSKFCIKALNPIDKKHLAEINDEVEKSDGVIHFNAANNQRNPQDHKANQETESNEPEKLTTLGDHSGLNGV